MVARVVYYCEICGSERKQANHWFEFYDNGEGAIGIRKFDKGNEYFKQVCGQGCAHTLLDRWLSTGSLDAAEVQPAVQILESPEVPEPPQEPAPVLDEEIPW